MLGPLFFKELLEMSRRRRYFALRTIVAGSLLLLLWRLLPETTVQPTPQLAAEIGYRLFSAWAVGVVVGIFLLLPASASGLVAGEKDAGTFEVLLTSCLSDREILVGKLASRLFLALILILSSIPVVAVASFYGGFDLTQVARAGAVHLIAALFALSLSLYYSVVTHKPYVALIRTYVALVVLWVIVPTGLPLLVERLSGIDIRPMLGVLNPIEIAGGEAPAPTPQFQVLRMVRTIGGTTTTVQVVVPGQRVPGAVAFLPPPPMPGPPAAAWWTDFAGWSIHILLFLTISVVLFVRSKRNLRTALTRSGTPWLLRILSRLFQGLVSLARSFVEGRQHAVGLRQLWEWELRSRRWQRIEYALGERFNPLLMRNATANVYDPEHFVAMLQALTWIVFLGTVFYVGWVNPLILDDASLHRYTLIVEVLALFLFTLVLGACSFARERQNGSWDLLLQTDLSASQFVVGTLLGIVRALFPTILLLAISVVLAGIVSLQVTRMIQWLLVVGSMLALLGVCCMIVSLGCQRIMEAVFLSFLIVPTWFVLSLLLRDIRLNAEYALPFVPLAWVVARLWFGRGDHTARWPRAAAWTIAASVPFGLDVAAEITRRAIGLETVAGPRSPLYEVFVYHGPRTIPLFDYASWVGSLNLRATLSHDSLLFALTKGISTLALIVLSIRLFERFAGRRGER